MVFATITGAGVTTATKFYGDITNKFSNMFNGVDITDTVTINTAVTWTFKGTAFRIRDSDDSHSYIFQGDNIAADRTITIPVLAGNDTIPFPSLAQTWSGAQTFVAPLLGTPASGVLTNCSGTAVSLTAGNVSSPYNVVGLQDIFIPATAMWARTTSGAGGLTKVETATNKINYQVFEFDSASVEYVQFGWIPPRNYNNGTVKFTFWWTNAAGLTTETVDWDVAGVAFRNDDALEAAMPAAVTTTDTWIAQNDVHISPQSTAVTIGGTVQDSDFIMFEISRKVSTDNLTGDARLIGVVIEYTIDAATSA